MVCHLCLCIHTSTQLLTALKDVVHLHRLCLEPTHNHTSILFMVVHRIDAEPTHVAYTIESIYMCVCRKLVVKKKKEKKKGDQTRLTAVDNVICLAFLAYIF